MTGPRNLLQDQLAHQEELLMRITVDQHPEEDCYDSLHQALSQPYRVRTFGINKF